MSSPPALDRRNTSSVSLFSSRLGADLAQYAVEHRLPVMAPSWIQNGHAKWLKGEELDLEAEMETHKLKPFVGLRIAISGIEPCPFLGVLGFRSLTRIPTVDRRRQIVHYINHNGGVYSKDLDRKCTHLISAKPTADSQSSEKVKWAMKEVSDRENKRKAGKRVDGEDMLIVYEEWIWDCVGFEGRWKEEEYDARKARRPGRIRAGELLAHGDASRSSAVADVLNGNVKRELSRSPADTTKAEASESNEPAVLRKRKREAMNSLVGEIISTTAVKTEQPEPVPMSAAAEADPAATSAALRASLLSANEAKPGMSHPDPLEREKISRRPERISLRPEPEPARKLSMLHASRATSFTKVEPARPQSTTAQSPPSSSVPTSFPPTAPIFPIKDHDQFKPSANFFAGLRFSLVIAEYSGGLEKALVAHGGVLVAEQDRLDGAAVDFIVIRL